LNFDVFNLFNRKSNDIEYYYASRLNNPVQPEPASGVKDIHFHRPSRAPRPGAADALLRERVYLGILTRVTVLTRLFASTKLPSVVTEVLRTMLPPPGMVQLWNFAVLGSKRTTVFGWFRTRCTRGCR